MRSNLVYDLPLRLFHWSFVGLSVFAFAIAKGLGDDSPLFAFHSLAGVILGSVVLLRIIWGFWGTRHSRWSQMHLNPTHLVSYFKSFITKDTKRYAGHNPASSWAGLGMIVMIIGLVTTGVMMGVGYKKITSEELHEFFAHGLLILALAHIFGLILHTLRFRDMIGLSMVDGRKSEIETRETISESSVKAAVVGSICVASFAIYVYSNYDSKRGSLNLFGTTIQVSDGESWGEDEE